MRERLLAKSRETEGEKLARNTKELNSVGTPVVIQNQTGRYPTKWDKTGIIVEVRPHSQLVIKVDGSRRLTLRNRRFVKEIVGFDSWPSKYSLPGPEPASPFPAPIGDRVTTSSSPSVSAPATDRHPVVQVHDDQVHAEMEGLEQHHHTDQVEEDCGDNIGGADPAVRHEEEGPAGVANTDEEHRSNMEGNSRPVRQRKQNTRYSAEEYDLNVVRNKRRKSRRQVKRAVS